MYRISIGDVPGIERDLSRLTGAVYYLMMPVFFLTITLAFGVGTLVVGIAFALLR